MRRALIALALALALSGCAAIAGPYESYVREFKALAARKAAQAQDEALEAAEWWMCRGASVGSINRRYGSSREHMAAWAVLCASSGRRVGHIY